MNEKDFSDLLVSVGLSRLLESKTIMDEDGADMEIHAILQEAKEKPNEEVEKNIAMLVNRIQYDLEQAYKAGFKDGVRFSNWMKE